jgi:hypothetical protein
MEKNNNRSLLIGLSVILIGGISYFLWKKFRKNSLEDSNLSSDEQIIENVSKPISKLDPNPFKNSSEVKAFQDWLDKNKPFWIKDSDGKWKNLRIGTKSEPNRHVKGKGYGNYGPYTSLAYTNFKNEYKSSF